MFEVLLPVPPQCAVSMLLKSQIQQTAINYHLFPSLEAFRILDNNRVLSSNSK